MEGLIKAAFDFLAAILSGLGFVGVPRRRANIEHNLGLLDKLRASPDFGPDSRAHRLLQDHITGEVAKFSGADIKRKQKVPWGSVLWALAIGTPMGYWTYKLDQHGFRLVSILTAIVAGLMLLAVLGMVFYRDEEPEARPDPAPAATAPQTAPSTGTT